MSRDLVNTQQRIVQRIWSAYLPHIRRYWTDLHSENALRNSTSIPVYL